MKGCRKINWVKWSVVCQLKENGGLGVKDVHLMNLSLLAKWRWRLLYGEDNLWKEELGERYGRRVCAKLEGGEEMCPNNASKWWKDLVNLDKKGEGEWFNEEIERRVGDGASTPFWTVAWRGEVPFKDKYNRLFSIFIQQEAMVDDMWEENDEGGRWAFRWRRRLFVWEENIFTNLLGALEGFVRSNEEDKWRWNLGEEEVFTVKSLYGKLEEGGRVEGSILEGEKLVFRNIWKTGAPSKVITFVWKTLLDRIPSRVNLEIRRCLPPNIGHNCVWCGLVLECTSHIFLHCAMAMNIWRKLMDWLDLYFLMPPNLFIHWECWSGRPMHKKIRKGLMMIWQAAIWVIWRVRNNCIFNTVVKQLDELEDEIKVLSWRWLLGRFKVPAGLFYEWEWSPVIV